MEKKLKLQVEDLTIDSFETAAVVKRSGTVHGAGATEWNTCPGYGQTCDGGNTCWDSCGCVSYPDYCGGGDSGLQLSCVHSCQWTCPVCRPTPGEIC